MTRLIGVRLQKVSPVPRGVSELDCLSLVAVACISHFLYYRSACSRTQPLSPPGGPTATRRIMAPLYGDNLVPALNMDLVGNLIRGLNILSCYKVLVTQVSLVQSVNWTGQQ